MNKARLDMEFTRHYEKFLIVARGVCIRKGRLYDPEHCVAELYLYLVGIVERLDEDKGIHNFGVKRLRQSIAWGRSSLNLKEITIYPFIDRVDCKGQGGGDEEGSAIDKLKNRINEEKGRVKDRINLLFLSDLAGEVDYNKKSLAEYYDISTRSVEILVRSARDELRN